MEDVFPILFLDALIVKVRDGGAVRNRACYVAIGVNLDGERDVLGLWFQASEGAKFWLHVLTELKQRGVRDVLICCVDGLKGFPEAIGAVYPETWVQTCIVHLIRHSLRFVPDKYRRPVPKDLKPIYTAQKPIRPYSGSSTAYLTRIWRAAHQRRRTLSRAGDRRILLICSACRSTCRERDGEPSGTCGTGEPRKTHSAGTSQLGR